MRKSILRDSLLTGFILLLAFGISVLFQNIFQINEHISTLFVFAVFLISLWTDGYVYGIIGAVVGTLAINYAFTFPYFDFNFTIPVNLISAIVMVIIALLTSALTTQNKLHQQIEAESEKERMRANLLRAVSHDIRTPLTSIYGSASMLIDEKDSLTSKQKLKMLDSIKQDADWLVRMVENLLSVTRIDQGKVKLTKTPIVVDELVDSVLAKFKKRYPQVTVTLSLPEQLIVVPMDALLIDQVLSNLLENVVLHATGFTKIDFKVSLLNNHAVFEIIDDGCGIPEEKLPTLFQGNFESDNKVADSQKKNTGIGLSVCETIISAHGGNIFAQNTKTGAKFSFYLEIEEE